MEAAQPNALHLMWSTFGKKVFASLNAWIKSLLEASFCLSMTLREQHIGRSPKATSVEAILGAERRRRRDYNSAPVLLSDYRQTNPLIGPNLLPHSGVLKGRGRIFAFWKRKNISLVWEIAVLASSPPAPPLRRNLEIKGRGLTPPTAAKVVGYICNLSGGA